MITAIILCRNSSSRLPGKHFKKIGNNQIIDLILNKLKKNKYISETYIATGKKSKNKIFYKKIKSNKFKNLKFYFHNKENDVTKRVYEITKKIQNNYSLIISGDCPLIDNDYIKRLYKKIQISKPNVEFIVPNKKVLHEGIFLFRTNSWTKINQLSNNPYFQEHPASIINYKKEKFKKSFLKIKKIERKRDLRLSIDTQSDLDFFNVVLKFSKKKEICFKDLIKFKYLNFLNKHVSQRQIFEKYNQKINIITNKDSNNYFHKYSKIIQREVSETISSNIRMFYKPKKLIRNMNDINIYCSSNHAYQNLKKNKIPKNSIFIQKFRQKNNNKFRIVSKNNNKYIYGYINDREDIKNNLIKNNKLKPYSSINFLKKNHPNIGCKEIIREIYKLMF